MKLSHILALFALTIGIALSGLLAPLAAQTENPDDLIFLTGTVDLRSGRVVVGDFVLVAGSAPLPPLLRQNDYVIVIGALQADGTTVRIASIEIIDDPDATPQPTPEVTPELTPVVTPEITPEVTPSPTAQPGDCVRQDHPAAGRYAEAFGVPVAEIIGWHCAGFGFGEIARAYLLAEATGETPASYFEQRRSGLGWGQIMRGSDVRPSDLAPGRVGRGNGRGGDDTDDDDGGRGNGNGNGGRGNGGRGNGNGNSGRGNGGGRGG
jgi:hypothetical protein